MPVISTIVQDDQGRTVLRIAPPKRRDPVMYKGKVAQAGSPACMPDNPVDVPLYGDDMIKLAKSLVARRSSFSSIVFGHDVDRKDILNIVQTFNTVLENQVMGEGKQQRAGVGARVCLGEMRDDVTLSLRFDPEVWDYLADDMKIRADTVFVPVPASSPRALAAETRALPVDMPHVAAAPSGYTGPVFRPAKTRLRGARPARPEWADAAALPVPHEDVIPSFPLLSLGDAPKGNGKILHIKPDYAHAGHAAQSLRVTNPIHILILEHMVAKPAGVTFGRKEVEGLQRSDVADALLTLNDALNHIYTGISIKRYVMKKNARRSCQGRMVMKFDARKWGPMPAEQAGHGSQQRSEQPKRKISQADVKGAPIVRIEGYVTPNNAARLIIEPQAEHVGQKPITILIHNNIQRAIVKAAISAPRGGTITDFHDDYISYTDMYAAHRYLAQQLEEQGAGMQLHMFRMHGQNVCLRYDACQWGNVPRAYAMKGTMPAAAPREGQQMRLALVRRRKPDEAPRAPIQLKRSRGRPLGSIKRLPDPEPVQPDLLASPRVVAKTVTEGQRRKVRIDPRQLQLPIVLEEKQGIAKIIVQPVELTRVEVSVTPRQAQLFKTVAQARLASPTSFHSMLGDALDKIGDESDTAARIRAMRDVRVELAALDKILVKAVTEAAPHVIAPSRVDTAKIIAFCSDVYVRERKVKLEHLEAA